MMVDIQDLVIKVKENNCEDSLVELVTRTEKLVYRVYHRYGASLTGVGVILEDLFNEIPLLIYNACLKFNPARFKKKSKFTTFLVSFARWECLNLINANRRHDRIDSVDVISSLDKKSKEAYYSASSEFNQIIKENSSFILKSLEELEDKRALEICKLRFFSTSSGKPLAWRKVGKELNLSGQGCQNLFKKNTNLLRAKLETQNKIL